MMLGQCFRCPTAFDLVIATESPRGDRIDLMRETIRFIYLRRSVEIHSRRSVFEQRGRAEFLISDVGCLIGAEITHATEEVCGWG